jgi:branched-chain amino acid transport system ATP-binding protein
MMSSIASEGPLLRIDALTRSFGGFVALDNISVEIRKGERFGLIGPNGSGKTTLVNCISGALRPNKGTVRFREEDRQISALTVASRGAFRFRGHSGA